MREQVCIVLNERETTKAKAAEALSACLSELDITSSRIPVTENIEAVLKQRLPRVVVIDYLLGDFSTGLDILQSFKNIDADRRPKVIFLTDEPSLQVAVEALREGARHYIELDDPKAISKVSEEIRNVLSDDTAPPASPKSLPKLDDLIFGATTSLRLRNQIQETAAKRTPIVLIQGNPGSGVSTIARTLQGLHIRSTYTRCIDLDRFDGNILEICGLSPVRDELRLGFNLSLVVEHVEEEDGTLLEYLMKHHERLWPSSQQSQNNSFLILCSTEKSALTDWKRRFPVEVIAVPSLTERTEDITAFVQRFIREAEEFTGKKVKPFPAEIISWLSNQKWPGELRQLRSLVIDSAIGTIFGEENIREGIERRYEAWEDTNKQDTTTPIDALSAAAILELSGFRYQVAAARLGCSTRHLYALLHQSPNKESRS